MSFLRLHEPTLLDTAHRWPTEWWLVYTDTQRPHWWNRFLDPQFRHVQALRRDGRVWVAFRPHTEFLDVEILRTDETPWQLFPDAVIQRVVALRKDGKMRSVFHMGPITCVEHVKALLGISSPWIRTPKQLHWYCREHLAFPFHSVSTAAHGNSSKHSRFCEDGRAPGIGQSA